jgi:quinol monooxygenase YgiN
MSQKTLRVVARVVALPDKVEQLKTILLKLIEPTRAEPGCVQYHLLQNQAEPTDFTFVEEWASADDLENHLQSQHIQKAMVQINGLVVQAPDIRVYNQISV